MMNAVSKLPDGVRNKVLGVVLFGYTKNGQTKGSIPNYPKDRVMVLCSSGDGVCGGQLLVTAGHFSYMGDGSGPKATNFLLSAINGAGKGGASPSESSSGAAPAKAPKGKGKGGMGM
jgi:cutinase